MADFSRSVVKWIVLYSSRKSSHRMCGPRIFFFGMDSIPKKKRASMSCLCRWASRRSCDPTDTRTSYRNSGSVYRWFTNYRNSPTNSVSSGSNYVGPRRIPLGNAASAPCVEPVGQPHRGRRRSLTAVELMTFYERIFHGRPALTGATPGCITHTTTTVCDSETPPQEPEGVHRKNADMTTSQSPLEAC